MNQQQYAAWQYPQQEQQYTMLNFRCGIDDYDNIVKLGQGSYGMVFKGRNKTDGKTYVIKQINMRFLDQKQKQDAINEGNFLKHLESSFVVKYYDMFIENDDLFIVMEFCENGDLLQFLKKQKGQFLNENKIWLFFLQMLLGLHNIHSQKILHRDFKTMNMFLTKNSTEIRIGDLGVAKYLGETNNLAKTMVGTPYYLSPEICEEKPYNEKSDVWSLGCVLYELCTYKHPFEANNQGALIIKILKNKVEPLPSMYSKELQMIVNMLLIKDFQKRPDTISLLKHPIISEKLSLLRIPYTISDPDKKNRNSSMSIENARSKDIVSSNKERILTKSPTRTKQQQRLNLLYENQVQDNKTRQTHSITNIDEVIQDKPKKQNLHLQSTLPSNVDKGFINEILAKNNQINAQKKITRNKSEKGEKLLKNKSNVDSQMIQPPNPPPPPQSRAFQLSQRYPEENEKIEISKQSSLQNLQLPKNFAKEQQTKLESIIQNQRNVFFQPLINANGNIEHSKKSSKKVDSQIINNSQKHINVKDKYINDKTDSPTIYNHKNINNNNNNYGGEITNPYTMSINDYADQAFFPSQQKPYANQEQYIRNPQAQQNPPQYMSGLSPNMFANRKYFTPKVKTVRQPSVDQPSQPDSSNITQTQQSTNAQYQSQSTKNIIIANTSPTNLVGKRHLSNAINISNDRNILSPTKDQMKQINIFNQINQIGSQQSSNNLKEKEMMKAFDSQTYFNTINNNNNNSNHTIKLPDIQSSANLSTRPKSNVANFLEIFSQRNKQNQTNISQSQIVQQQQQVPPTQFSLQQQYSSRKNSSQGINKQQANFNANIFTNSSCIQLAVNQNNTETTQPVKKSMMQEEIKKSPSIVRGDHQVSQQKHLKSIENSKSNEDKKQSVSPTPINVRRTLKFIDSISNPASKMLIEQEPKRKHNRNKTHAENKSKKNNKSFQFDDKVEVSTYTPTAGIQEKSQRAIRDLDQFKHLQYNSNPTRYSKNSMIESTIETQISMKEFNEEINDIQQKYIQDRQGNEQKTFKKNLLSSSTTKSSQNSTQIGVDDKQQNRQASDFRKGEGSITNQQNINNGFSEMLKEEEDFYIDNGSALLTEKRQKNGLSQMLNQQEMKKSIKTPTLPKINQQIPISRNLNIESNYSSNHHPSLSQIQKYDSNRFSPQAQYSNLRQNSMGGGVSSYQQYQSNLKVSSKNIFNTKDIQELNQLFELESNKIKDKFNMQPQYSQSHKDSVNISSSSNNLNQYQQQVNFQENNSIVSKQRASSSLYKKMEQLENEIIEFQSQMANKQRLLTAQIGASQFSDLFSVLKSKIKNVSELEQCNMKEIDSLITSSVKNCNSKIINSIYNLLKLQIKLEKAYSEQESLRKLKNY